MGLADRAHVAIPRGSSLVFRDHGSGKSGRIASGKSGRIKIHTKPPAHDTFVRVVFEVIGTNEPLT